MGTGLTSHQTPDAEVGEQWEEEDPELASAIAASLAASAIAPSIAADRAPSSAAASPSLLHPGPDTAAPAAGSSGSGAAAHVPAAYAPEQQPNMQGAADVAVPTPPEPDAGPGELCIPHCELVEQVWLQSPHSHLSVSRERSSRRHSAISMCCSAIEVYNRWLSITAIGI